MRYVVCAKAYDNVIQREGDREAKGDQFNHRYLALLVSVCVCVCV